MSTYRDVKASELYANTLTLLETKIIQNQLKNSRRLDQYEKNTHFANSGIYYCAAPRLHDGYFIVSTNIANACAGESSAT